MLKEKVYSEMVSAMKAHNAERKSALSNLLNHLNLAEKEKRSPLNEDEENKVVLKIVKQIKETIESCPDNRVDIKSAAETELAVVSEFAPQLMSEDEIKNIVNDVLNELGITTPSAKDKGAIMKVLMPRVKGKADGKLVNQLLQARFS